MIRVLAVRQRKLGKSELSCITDLKSFVMDIREVKHLQDYTTNQTVWIWTSKINKIKLQMKPFLQRVHSKQLQ